MQLLFLDDASQRKPSREKVGTLVAVGGVSVEANAARDLENAVNAYCHKDVGFPIREPFKWSPAKDHWMRDHLTGEQRVEFLLQVLKLAREHGAKGFVVISDKTKGLATQQADRHEMDVLVMILERFDNSIGNDLGMVIVARPSGGRSDEDAFLAECAEVVTKGTEYSRFTKIATNVLTMPFRNSRLLQVADLVVSVTTAMVAGHTEFAAPIFETIKPIFPKGIYGTVGGWSVKIHPDFSYLNLYHWLLGDEAYWRRMTGWDLPREKFPFYKNAHEY